MNMTPSQAVELINTLKPLVATEDADVVFCVPAIDIIPAIEAAKGSNIEIGAENMYYEEKGAYTGEIAPDMLTDVGVKYVIIGHSERREYFAETNETVNKKVLKAFEHGITPVSYTHLDVYKRQDQGVFLNAHTAPIFARTVTVNSDRNGSFGKYMQRSLLTERRGSVILTIENEAV